MEVNFCRRCGTTLTKHNDTAYVCKNGHRLFMNGIPAIGLFLVSPKNQVLLITRAIDPAKGKLDVPGGFVDMHESLEQTVERELREELHVEPSMHESLQFLCSATNEYRFDNEMMYPVDVFFWARAPKDIPVRPDDDAASVAWHSLSEIDAEDLAFKSTRVAFAKLKTHLA